VTARPASRRALLPAAASLILLITVAWAATIDGPLSTSTRPSWVTDAPNYYAAAERLNAGHPLYELGPSDRKLALAGWEPAPLLSPPLIAVAWRPLAGLPIDFTITVWTLIGLLSLIGSCLWLVWRSGPATSIGVLILSIPIGLTAWSGNVQTLLTPALCLAWIWHAGAKPARIGAVAGVGAVLKLASAPLLVWMVVTRQTRALAAFAVFAASAALISVAGAGIASHLDYLRVASEVSRIGGTALSAGGIAALIGVPLELRTFAAPATLALGTAGIVALRHHADRAFSIAIVTGLLGLTVVNLTNVTMLLAAFVPFGTGPWPDRSGDQPGLVT
jgi:Glycosyltransferase family 87